MSDTTVTVTGNLTHEPVRREVAPNRYVTTMRMAANQYRRDAEDNWVPVRTTYYTIKAWNGLGVNASTSFHKGDRVIVQGRLDANEWTDAEGKPRITLEIDAKHLGHEITFYTVARMAHTVPLAAPEAAATTADERDEAEDEGSYEAKPELQESF